MPMSESFKQCLLPVLPEIIQHYGTPLRIFYEEGIRNGARNLKDIFRDPIFDFREFYAVKAWPNHPVIARLMYREQGFGFDCSSPYELTSMRSHNIPPSHIILTSNDTPDELFKLAMADGGCILNLDDIIMIDRVPGFPELICFRYNPGERRTGTGFIGNPVDQKYGVPHHDIVKAYRRAIERGAKRFGLHTMLISNELNYKYMRETVRMLLNVVEMIQEKLGIRFEFINIGGGIGIPYRPTEKPFNLPALAAEAKKLLYQFKEKHGYSPRLFMECGRLITGPHAVLIAKVTQRAIKYHTFIGVDTCTSTANPRTAVYPETAYHHIDILDPDCRLKEGRRERVYVHGSLCENNDYFGRNIVLPRAEVGDFMMQHDNGAHAPAMGSNYNGWPKIPEVLFNSNRAELIRRGETKDDLDATLNHEEDILELK